MHLGGAGLEQHRHDLPGRVTADDRVVDGDDSLPFHFGERVELQLHALLAQALVGLDEGASDIAVLDQALAEVDAGGAGEADRRRRARVGDRQDQIGLDGRLLGEPLAHADTGAVDLDARQPRIRPREVEELEHAERAAVRLGHGLLGAAAFVVDHDELAQADFALEPGADEVERAGLGGEHPVAVEPAEHERPEAVRVAEADQLPLG